MDLKKYPGPKSIVKHLLPLAEWLRVNKPTCKRITATRDQMIGLRKARLDRLISAGMRRDGDDIYYAEFLIADPPEFKAFSEMRVE